MTGATAYGPLCCIGPIFGGLGGGGGGGEDGSRAVSRVGPTLAC